MRDSLPEQPIFDSLADENFQREVEKQRRQDLLEYWDAAAVMSIDTDLRVFNRFKELRLFVILRLQCRLQAMAVSLESLRQKRTQEDMEPTQNDGLLDKLTMEIEDTLKSYDAALLSSLNVGKLRNPSQNFLNQFTTNFGFVFPKILCDLGVYNSKLDSDAVFVIGLEEKSWTHALIDQSQFLQRLFKVEKTKHSLKHFVFETYSDQNIRRAENIFANVTFSIMLVCPIIALSFIQNTTAKLAVVLSFLLLAAILTSGILRNTNNAGLAVLAGYGAILVFFLGVKTGSSS